jgi:hypothetical protein
VENLRELLGKKYLIDVLIYVFEHPGEMQKTITDEGKEGKVAKRDRLSDLVAAGLIRSDTSGGKWTAIRYYVTDEGARVARGLIRIESGGDVGESNNSTPEEGRYVMKI